MDLSTLTPQAVMANSKEETCSECGGYFFIPVMMLRRLSKLLIGQSNDALIPHQVFICNDCKSPIMDMVPPQDPIKEEEKVQPKQEGEAKIIGLITK